MFTKKVSLSDGTEVVIRPVQPQDVVAILEMHDRTSQESLYYRYLRSYKPSYEEISRISELTDREGATFVAVIENPWETVVGMAYYMIEQERWPLVAQPAFLVEDRFQGQGIGRVLFQQLCQHARNQGIHSLDMDIHPANLRSRRLVERSKFPFEEKLAYGTREMRLLLNPEPVAVQASANRL